VPDAGELICKNCLENKLNFLKFYPSKEFVINVNDLNTNTIDVLKNDEITFGNIKDVEEKPCTDKKRKFEEAFPDDKFLPSEKKLENNVNEVTIINSKELIEGSILKDNLENPQFCKLEFYKKMQNVLIDEKDLFVDIKYFYNILCKCLNCKDLYRNNNVEFIIEDNFLEDITNRNLIEDQLNNEAEEENKDNEKVISNLDDCDIFNIGEVRDLPIEKVKIKNNLEN